MYKNEFAQNNYFFNKTQKIFRCKQPVTTVNEKWIALYDNLIYKFVIAYILFIAFLSECAEILTEDFVQIRAKTVQNLKFA